MTGNAEPPWHRHPKKPAFTSGDNEFLWHRYPIPSTSFFDHTMDLGNFGMQRDGGGRMKNSHRNFRIASLKPPYYRPTASNAEGYYGRSRSDFHSDPYAEIRHNEMLNRANAFFEASPCFANAGPSRLDIEWDTKCRSKNSLLFLPNHASAHVENIQLAFDITARHILMTWTAPLFNEGVKYTYEIEIEQSDQSYKVCFPWYRTRYSFLTKPGDVYKVTIICRSLSNNKVLAKESTTVKAVFSTEELRRLYDRAMKVNGTDMQSFRYLYRCKPQSYWDDIYQNYGGIMEPYVKDNNGQPANNINGAISGLFFSARLFRNPTTGLFDLPTASPFGDVRLAIEAPALLNPEQHAMYFADFYCNKDLHYVTLVICLRDSFNDMYCSHHLVRLNPEDNAFLKIQYYAPSPQLPAGGCEFYVNKNVWVEVLYTDQIDIRFSHLENICATGLGTSRLGGLPNNKHCEVCNLYPLEKTPQRTMSMLKISSESNDLTDPRESTLNTCISFNEEFKDSVGEEWPIVMDIVCALVDSTCEHQSVNDCEQLIMDSRKRESLSRLKKAYMEVANFLQTTDNIELIASANEVLLLADKFNEWFEACSNRLAKVEKNDRELCAWRRAH